MESIIKKLIDCLPTQDKVVANEAYVMSLIRKLEAKRSSKQGANRGQNYNKIDGGLIHSGVCICCRKCNKKKKTSLNKKRSHITWGSKVVSIILK